MCFDIHASIDIFGDNIRHALDRQICYRKQNWYQSHARWYRSVSWVLPTTNLWPESPSTLLSWDDEAARQWTINHWKWLFCGHKSRFTLYHLNSRAWVLHLLIGCFLPKFIAPTINAGEKAIMVWRCFYWFGLGLLDIIHGKISTGAYSTILEAVYFLCCNSNPLHGSIDNICPIIHAIPERSYPCPRVNIKRVECTSLLG